MKLAVNILGMAVDPAGQRPALANVQLGINSKVENDAVRTATPAAAARPVLRGEPQRHHPRHPPMRKDVGDQPVRRNRRPENRASARWRQPRGGGRTAAWGAEGGPKRDFCAVHWLPHAICRPHAAGGAGAPWPPRAAARNLSRAVAAFCAGPTRSFPGSLDPGQPKNCSILFLQLRSTRFSIHLMATAPHPKAGGLLDVRVLRIDDPLWSWWERGLPLAMSSTQTRWFTLTAPVNHPRSNVKPRRHRAYARSRSAEHRGVPRALDRRRAWRAAGGPHVAGHGRRRTSGRPATSCSWLLALVRGNSWSRAGART